LNPSKGARAIVTGAYSAIGEATARLIVELGVEVNRGPRTRCCPGTGTVNAESTSRELNYRLGPEQT
jgi:NAD(P)-dependent dehydrogenase (short-subunit alcohol dehydrogenase family)